MFPELPPIVQEMGLKPEEQARARVYAYDNDIEVEAFIECQEPAGSDVATIEQLVHYEMLCDELGGLELAVLPAKNETWDEIAVNIPGSMSPVLLVYRREPRPARWVPWVVVAPSAIMRRNDLQGLGLYAARRFKDGECIGHYDGWVAGTFDSTVAALKSDTCTKLARSGKDKLITRRVAKERGVQLIDGDSGGPPYLQRMCDPRGTMLGVNAEINDFGKVSVCRSRGIPAFNFERTVEDNIDSEIRIDYGSPYWFLIDRLGKSKRFAIQLD